MHFVVRAVSEDDAPAIVALLNPLIAAGAYTVLDEPSTVADQLAFIRNLPERSVYHAAVRDGRVVGIQDVVPLAETRVFDHVGEISTFVALDARRQGVGRALCAATVTAARRLRFRKLLATIRADNAAALAYYTGCGFREIGTAQQHAHVGDRYVDEVLAERAIDPLAGDPGM